MERGYGFIFLYQNGTPQNGTLPSLSGALSQGTYFELGQGWGGEGGEAGSWMFQVTEERWKWKQLSLLELPNSLLHVDFSFSSAPGLIAQHILVFDNLL